MWQWVKLFLGELAFHVGDLDEISGSWLQYGTAQVTASIREMTQKMEELSPLFYPLLPLLSFSNKDRLKYTMKSGFSKALSN